MKANYKAKTFEEKKKEVEALTSHMEESIKNYFRTHEQMKEYLQFMGQFYKYSNHNIALMKNAFPGARAVGSFLFWKEKGFTVNKGEKGIKILVPNRSQPKFQKEDGKWESIKKASKEQEKLIKEGKLKAKEGTLYFSVGHVFDVSQTNATAKDLPAIFPNRWLEGNVENYQTFQKGMEQIAANNGISIVAPKYELGSAKGVSYTLTKEVALNPRNSELQNVKTLLHELTHAKLHTSKTFKDYTDAEKEFQAEMTAYTVASHFGIDTSEYSLRYLHNWTADKEFKDHAKLLKEVHGTVIEFIDTIEETLLKEKEKQQQENEKKELHSEQTPEVSTQELKKKKKPKRARTLEYEMER